MSQNEKAGAPTLEKLRELGVARASYGPAPYHSSMSTFKRQAEDIYATAMDHS